MTIETFADIVGAEAPLRILRQGVMTGRTAHAYLFVGPQGVGKRTVAMAFMRALLCANPDEGDACGICPPCRKTAQGNHPDLVVVEPEVREKKVKKEIDIQHIRALTERLSYRPYEGKVKGVVIDDVEKMNVQAANAFLKTLEEPPGDTVMVLIAANARTLLPTVVSRCRTVGFGPAPHEAMSRFLGRRLMVDEAEAATLAALAGGAPGRALDKEGLEREKAIREMVAGLILNPDALSAAEAVGNAIAFDKNKDRTVTDRALCLAQDIVRDIAAVKTTGEYATVINVDLSADVAEAARRYPLRRLLAAHDTIERMKRARVFNVNPQLIFGLLSIELKK